MPAGVVLGLNQYTHSAAACLGGPDGEPLFAGAKERLTRKKHDGGDVAELVEHALASCGLALGDLELAVANNHLFRIDAFESTLEWAQALDQYRPSYLRPTNLLPGVAKRELSHHLAHAWSVMPLAPFEEGLIVVMDGIGSTWRERNRPGDGYASCADLPRAGGFQQVPETPEASEGWREGESVFSFRGLELELLFKRWIREHTPTLLYNYGFENMESLGAVYSRVSSHVFGDWNACGKVMGMAPWAPVWNAGGAAAEGGPDEAWVLRGPLEQLQVNWPRLRSAPHPNGWEDEAHRPGYAQLSHDLQRDLEQVVLPFLAGLRERTGARNLCLAGGVALNSTLNGRICRETGFEQVYIPPWPGDDGVAVGCALYGHHQLRPAAPAARRPWSPLLGAQPGAEEREEALAAYAPWIEVEPCPDPAEAAAEAVADGQVLGWFQGRAEFGPRALGNRSILADPRDGGMVARINAAIKKREAFRPFAPTVLAEKAEQWFEGVTPTPYMSLTVSARAGRAEQIPAVVHVDGSARIQTLGAADNPGYRRLIEAFEARTGLPMVLNTSFNIRGEPLVESAEDAIRSFLESDLDLLVLEDRLVRKAAFPAPATAGSEQVRPVHEAGTAELVSDPDGEPLSQQVLSGGRTVELSPLEHGLWENCDGEAALEELLAAFEQEWELAPSDCLAALERLWSQRLIRFL